MESEELFICENCGNEFEYDDLTRINGHLYCEDCFEICDCCGANVLRTYETAEDGDICSNCVSSYYLTCDRCGGLYHADTMHNHRGDTICESCYECMRSTYGIRDYHDGPCLLVRSVDDSEDKRSYWSDDMLTIGIEQEAQGGRVDACQRAMGIILDDESFGWMERDGSLDDGFELVSMPMTKEFFDTRYPLTDICKCFSSHHMKAHDPEEPGLHIHLSWSWFGISQKSQRDTLLKCVYLLDKYRDEFFSPISRRSDDSLNNWAEPLNMRYPRDWNEFENKSGHYKIINARCNTVELRLFKGSIQEKSIRAAVDLYTNLIDICKMYTWDIIELLSVFELRTLLEEDSEYLHEYFELRFKDGFKPLINLKSNLLLRRLRYELNDGLKSDWFNQSYQELSMEIEDVYSTYRSRYEMVFNPCIPDVLETEYENTHFMSMNPVSEEYLECN